MSTGWDDVGGAFVTVAPGVVTSARWTSPPIDLDDPPYRAQLTVEHEGGRMVCRELVVQRLPGGPPVTSEGLHAIPVRRLIRNGVYRFLMDVNASGARELLQRDPAELRAAGPTEESLRVVAYVYRLAYLASDPPVVAVAQHFGLPRSTAGRWVQRARAGGFLGSTTSGRAGEDHEGGADDAG